MQQTLSTLKYLSVPASRHPATLQRTATLQHTTTRCNKPRRVLKYISMTALRYPATLQHTATHCNTLQHAATHLVDFKIHLHARFEASCYGCHVIFLATLPADEIGGTLPADEIGVVHKGVGHISTQARLALAEIQSNIYSFQRWTQHFAGVVQKCSAVSSELSEIRARADCFDIGCHGRIARTSAEMPRDCARAIWVETVLLPRCRCAHAFAGCRQEGWPRAAQLLLLHALWYCSRSAIVPGFGINIKTGVGLDEADLVRCHAPRTSVCRKSRHLCCSVLQCIAVCCSALQRAVSRSELQCVAVVLQWVAVCCSALQRSVSMFST